MGSTNKKNGGGKDQIDAELLLQDVSENKTCALKTVWYKTGTREPGKRLRRGRCTSSL
jgi:hypothetical protein